MTKKVFGRIVPEFSQCNDFFYNGIPPRGIKGDYKLICQQYKNKYRFATLYSPISCAPLYSAYKVSRSDAPRPKDEEWMYEPQLIDERRSAEMQPIENIKVEYNNQASLSDYQGSIYTKGHLAPSQHLETKEDKESTFTLTNVVPQREGSNNGQWATWEKEILNIKNRCTGDMYVITGGIPFIPPKKMNDKVSVPEYMWSAYCCKDFQNNAGNLHFPTYAAVGRNDPNSPEDIVKKDCSLSNNEVHYCVAKMSLKNLEEILQKRLNTKITLFDGDCQASSVLNKPTKLNS
ncbi:endonuclease domain-containing 1 protein-like [Nematolebias whitei]|uniref:endonuclease domain-containing 1 protein-like n=1 Tax=Nematolebias whitei TaxID=451745 RepID=UPI0018981DB1|nr:endonuclease domain-containing 1 protein-like [Nematolebias whitei]